MRSRLAIINLNGQSAIEFLILVGAVLFFFLGILFAINLNIENRLKDNKDLAIQELAFSVQDEISLASQSSSGYYREFATPQTVLGLEYEIDIIAESVYVRTINGRHAVSLPVENVTGNPIVGDNFIRNINGTVFLNS